MLLGELIEYRGDLGVVLSRPCVYGVFSGPLGGFAPRQQHCVGCLRCTVQYPEVVQIVPNPDRVKLGDSYFSPDQVDTVLYEAATGRVPVRGAGYGGGFGGTGWDSMWTDMSEIVRPTRDGIHGREFISTAVELGAKPRSLDLDAQGALVAPGPESLRLPIPILFDPIRSPDRRLATAARMAAERLETFALLPLDALDGSWPLAGTAPSVGPGQVDQLLHLDQPFELVELEQWDRASFQRLKVSLPKAVISVRHPLGEPVGPLADGGVELIHLTANYHGQSSAGFAMHAIRSVHEELVRRGIRDQLSLIGSGGVVAAEHLPKAIISGLDAVAVDTALAVALQARFLAEVETPEDLDSVDLPAFDLEWGAQRIVNLVASWRDQLLEILGAMGLREVQRLRGEFGRAMFQDDLEREAFGAIPGFEARQ